MLTSLTLYCLLSILYVKLSTMLHRTGKFSWSVLQSMKKMSRLIQHRNSSSASKTITYMYGGHIPVLVDEIMEILDPKDNKLYVDMTFGAGGHTKEILQRAPDARIVCLDQDPTAHELAVKLSKVYSPGQIIPCLGKFSDIPEKFAELNIDYGSVDGFVFDVGASSMQFDTPERGFGLAKDGDLDMRMDQGRENSITAMDVVNNLDADDLYKIIKKYGGEKNARRIASALVESRYAFGKITRTKQLAEIIETVFEESYTHDKLHRKAHVATRTFQAIRIFVNNELNELHNGLIAAHHFLKSAGKCVVVTFHSLEDRIVKRHFHDIDLDEKMNMSLRQKFRMKSSMVTYETDEVNKLLHDKKWTPVSKHVIVPTEKQCQDNPRCRSAKLRAAIKS